MRICKKKYVIGLHMEHQRVHKTLFIPVHSRIELIELQFEERGKSADYPWTTSGAEKRANEKLNPNMTPAPGIEPGTHLWEASAFTTAPSLLPQLEEKRSR